MAEPTFDLIVRGGTVVDGTGAPARRADVGVRDGRVVAIGRLDLRRGTQELEAEGMVVAPGIVDAHTHYDPQVTFDPIATSSSYHGVTTVLAGNCGFSVAPTAAADRDYIQALFARVEEMHPNAMSAVTWEEFESFGEYRRSRTGRLGINMACHVGHSSVRRWVMGPAATEREATEEEITAMSAIVREAISDGAAGFSSSHSPVHLDGDERPIPSRFSSKDELLALASAAGEAGRGTVTYNASTMNTGFEPKDQDLVIDMAKASGLPVVISNVLRRIRTDAPGECWDRAMAFLERSQASGALVYSLLPTRPRDRPVTFNDRNLHYRSVFSWHAMLQLPLAERMAVLADPSARDELRHAVEHYNRDPEKGTTNPPPPFVEIFVAKVANPANEALVGRTIAEIAAERSASPGDVMLDLALAENCQTVFRWTDDDEEWTELTRNGQLHPQMIVGESDGGAHLARHDSADWSSWFLRSWVLDRKVWSLEEGIRQITQVPAALLGFCGRGTLELGNWADLFVFDPERIGPGGTEYAENSLPGGAGRYLSHALGVRATIVNGQPIIIDGQPTGTTPGRWVAPGSFT